MGEDFITRRLSVFCLGILMLAVGVVLAIKANLGVSPVSSVSYALALIVDEMSIGVATFVSNLLYILVQFIITRKANWKDYFIQLAVVALLSVFIDLMMMSLAILPSSNTLVTQFIYLVLSLFIISGALFLLLNTKLPLMPYDSLVPLLYTKYKWPIGKTRISCDVVNVSFAALCCLFFLQSLGSVGIGTVISALFIGQILGAFMRKYGTSFTKWLFQT